MPAVTGKSKAIIDDLNSYLGYSKKRDDSSVTAEKLQHYREIGQLHRDTIDDVKKLLDTENISLEEFKKAKDESKLNFKKFFQLFKKEFKKTRKKIYSIYKKATDDKDLVYNNQNAMEFGVMVMKQFLGLLPFLHNRDSKKDLASKAYIQLVSKLTPLIEAMVTMHDNILSGIYEYWENKIKDGEASGIQTAIKLDSKDEEEPIQLDPCIKSQSEQAIQEGYELSLSEDKAVPKGVKKKYKAKDRDESSMVAVCPGSFRTQTSDNKRESTIDVILEWMVKQLNRLKQNGLLKPALDSVNQACKKLKFDRDKINRLMNKKIKVAMQF